MAAQIIDRAQAIQRLREKAADEIERLLALLDRTEPDSDLEAFEPSGIADLDGLLEQTVREDRQPVFYI